MLSVAVSGLVRRHGSSDLRSEPLAGWPIADGQDLGAEGSRSKSAPAVRSLGAADHKFDRLGLSWLLFLFLFSKVQSDDDTHTTGL